MSDEKPTERLLGGLSPDSLTNRDRIVSGWHQYLWDNWWSDDGPCGDCPIRCANHLEAPAPPSFNYDASLMIVGREPGVNEKSAHTANNRRSYVNTPPPDSPIYEETAPEDVPSQPPRLIQRHPGGELVLGTDRYSSIFEPTREVANEDAEHSGYSFWPGSDGPGTFFERSEAGPTLDIDETQIYYTNSLKCSTLDFKDGIEDPGTLKNRNVLTQDTIDDLSNIVAVNGVARDQCRQYLQDEIRLVAPAVVVPFGDKTIRHTLRALNYGQLIEKKFGTSLDEIQDTGQFIEGPANSNGSDSFHIAAYGSNPAVIPSYHWSQPKFSSNIKRGLGSWTETDDNRDRVDVYWDELIRRTQSELDAAPDR